MHFREVKVPQPADLTFSALASILKDTGFGLQTINSSKRVLIADRTDSRGWVFSLLIAVTLGLIGQAETVRVTARIDEAGGNSALLIEARPLYGSPGRYNDSNVVAGLLNALGQRLGLTEALG